MTRKVKAVLLSVFAMALSSNAQFTQSNARVESMADIFIIEDISYVYRYAAKMNQYKNDIQVTFPTPMLGIKSFGENFSAGAYVRNGLMLDQSNAATNFYALGRAAVNTVNPVPDITSDPTYIPHLLFGMSVAGMNIGVDLFYEWARTRYSDEYKTGTAAVPSTITTKQSATLYNPGFIGSIQLGVEEVPILLKAGVGFPRISGKSKITNETSGSPKVTTENKIKSESGLYLEFGGEAGIPLLGATFTPGIDFIAESYAFKANSDDADNKYRNNRFAAYAGLTKKAFSNGLWSALYQIKFNASKNDVTTSDSANDLQIDTLRQIFSVGAENGWDSVWVFDKVFARGGIGLSMTTPYRGAESDTADLSEKGQTTFRPVPTIGIGITKGVFELDVMVDLANWGGLATGPDVAAVTGTLRF
ncbi:MAG TPA: hypothetical protein VHO70_07915 [Chitinispirillaceae bacterium]|nr:hypothetical protein [Chitinispirillaceae bacterium]